MDFFADEPSSRAQGDSRSPTESAHQRRRPDRRRTRIQRIAILAVVLFVVVFAVAWWARSCQHSRTVGSYRTYFEGVGTAISDSARLGKQFNRIVGNPTRLSRQELIASLNEMSDKQHEIAVRAARLEPPSALVDEQAVFATGMQVRDEGYRLLRAAMLGALSNQSVGPQEVAALGGYFSGPDAYYMNLVYQPARDVMSAEGVSDVAVPIADYYLGWKALDPARLESMLGSVGSSSKMSGIHGVALTGVTAKSGTDEVNLVAGGATQVPASADLALIVKVMNQGSVKESSVKVVATFVLPGGSVLKREASIATIAPSQTQSVAITGFSIPEAALTKTCTLKVTAGPVPKERVSSNNSAQFQIQLQLK